MRGELVINGYDAYERWGLSLEPEGWDALTAYPPNKEPVTNKNVTANGASVVCGVGLRDERNVSIAMHIHADDYIVKRNLFIQDIRSGANTLVTKFGTHTFYYLSCQNYAQTDGLVKFMLNVYEPDPMTPEVDENYAEFNADTVIYHHYGIFVDDTLQL